MFYIQLKSRFPYPIEKYSDIKNESTPKSQKPRINELKTNYKIFIFNSLKFVNSWSNTFRSMFINRRLKRGNLSNKCEEIEVP